MVAELAAVMTRNSYAMAAELAAGSIKACITTELTVAVTRQCQLDAISHGRPPNQKP
jgi:hypothetical protein